MSIPKRKPYCFGVYPAPKTIFHFPPKFDRFQRFPYWILRELILGDFYLQILGPNFGRAYLNEHKELEAHIRHACRMGIDPGRTKKLYMVYTQTAHPPKNPKTLQNQWFGAQLAPQPGRPYVPFGCTYWKALLGRNSMDPYKETKFGWFFTIKFWDRILGERTSKTRRS